MRVLAGPEKKSRLISEKEKAITAYHETGHALVGHFLPNTDPVHKITIVSRGQALGFTISLPTEDKFLTTKNELMDNLAMTLGGRAAEEIVFGDITTGRGQRHREGDQHRQADDHALRHEREARPADPRATTPRCPSWAASSSSRPTTPRRSPARSTTRSGASSTRRTSAPSDLLVEHREQLDAIAAHPHRARDPRARPSSRPCSTACPRKRSSASATPRRRRRQGEPRGAAKKERVAAAAGRRADAGEPPRPSRGHLRPRPSRTSLARGPGQDRSRASACILEGIGEDPRVPGLVETPRRVAEMYAEIFSGIARRDPAELLVAMPGDHHHEMVLVQRHRLLLDLRAPPAAVPRHGPRRLHPERTRPHHRALEAGPRGAPRGRGRPQLQERITSQVADAIDAGPRAARARSC